jgi:hypothetical protein
MLARGTFPSGPHLTWLKGRGLTEETLREGGLRSVPRVEVGDTALPEGIAIPCRIGEALWYVKVRRFGPGPKYLQVRGGRPFLFGADRVQPGKPVVLVESELDALLIAQEVPWVSAVALGTALRKPSLQEVAFLARSPRWLVALDADQAGERGNGWWRAFSGRAQVLQVPCGKDPTEFVQQGGDLREWLGGVR